MENERGIVGEDSNNNNNLGNSPDNSSDVGFGGSSSSASSATATPNKGRSCKGCLYYSSTLKSNSSNPVCVGLTRSLPRVPRYVVGESEMQASKEGRRLTDFRYACVGYSLYPDKKNHSADVEETQSELPVCMGLEVLVDRRGATVDSASAHVHNREDGHAYPQPRTHKPSHSIGDEFLSKFARNANLVATGVVKNMRKVGNRIKESVDDIIYPYRRRPK